VHIRSDGYSTTKFAESPKKSYCFFEWVYFSNAASTLNDVSVYVTRRKTGEALAREEPEKIDDDCIVVPVPDTSRAAADAMAHDLGIPCYEGLMRNRYVGRTFIESRSRFDKARRKYHAVAEVLRGKRVFLVEDSIVRSTTLRVIIGMIRDKGEAKEIHVRVACPPIMAPCSYGIDMSTVSELFAPRILDKPVRGDISPENLEKLASDLGADSLRYLRIDALADCIGLPEKDLCMGCLTGEYPTEWGNKLYREANLTREEAAPDGVVPEGRRTHERRTGERRRPGVSGAPSGGAPGDSDPPSAGTPGDSDPPSEGAPDTSETA
jgi:amidophosphoribosyltransferase